MNLYHGYLLFFAKVINLCTVVLPPHPDNTPLLLLHAQNTVT
jgi:hypothetical protein